MADDQPKVGQIMFEILSPPKFFSLLLQVRNLWPMMWRIAINKTNTQEKEPRQFDF